ncbi:hypothetical protein AB0C28_21600 [Nonomuraea sp. NPDC048892]|uniref:hypothetical protein n=1 Tax=Nonomuraea sp. NPDC048892 TaxID=3154624 RepID=UPI003407E4EE
MIHVASWTSRYRSGEHVAVWNEISAHGAAGVPENLREDAEKVAFETMHRVATNLDVLVDRLSSANYAFASPDTARQSPTTTDLEAIAKAETIIGPLPLSVRACLTIVGSVDLCGDGGSLLPHVRYHTPLHESCDVGPDPLVLHSGQMLWDQLSSVVGDLDLGCACTDPGEEEPCAFHASGFNFSIAPDRAAKENFSGGDQYVNLPAAHPDPQLECEWAPISLLGYLRLSLAWGGFPGYSIRPADVPPPPFLTKPSSPLLEF